MDNNIFKQLASKIIIHGPSKFNGSECIVPTGFIDHKEHPIDDAAYKKYGATHFDIQWKDFDKREVAINLYKSDDNSFGACINISKILSEVVVI
jgi:hypothetical protein